MSARTHVRCLAIMVVAGCGRADSRSSEATVAEPAIDIRAAITAELGDMLARGEAVELVGFGTFSIREYKPYEGRNPRTGEVVHVPGLRLVFFKAAQATREYIDGTTDLEPKVKAKQFVKRIARSAKASPNKIEGVLLDWTSDIVRRLRKHDSVAFGPLGFFRVVHKPEAVDRDPRTGQEIRIAARRTAIFRPSQGLKNRIAGVAASPTISRGAVKGALDAFPRRAVGSVSEASEWFKRLDVPTGDTGDVHMLFQRHLGRPPSPLTALLLSIASGEERLGVRPLNNTEALSQAVQFSGDILEAWEPIPEDQRGVIMVPFAQDQNDRYWYMCPHAPPSGDAWVFQLHEDGGHEHTYTLAGWVSGVLLLSTLKQIHPGGLLHHEDAERVLSRLSELDSPFGPSDLPY